MDLIEGVGASSSSPRIVASYGGYDIRNDVYNRLVETGNEEFVSKNTQLREVLDSHFNSLPSSYALDINMDRAQDVLVHHNLLTLAKNPDNRLVFHVRFVETFGIRADANNEEQSTSVPSTLMHCTDDKETDRGLIPSQTRSCRHEPVLVHEVIFSTVDKPKLLSQLSALLSDIGLNIREAHAFSTTDGYSLDVFVVDGWPVEDTYGLHEAVDKAIARSEIRRAPLLDTSDLHHVVDICEDDRFDDESAVLDQMLVELLKMMTQCLYAKRLVDNSDKPIEEDVEKTVRAVAAVPKKARSRRKYRSVNML